MINKQEFQFLQVLATELSTGDIRLPSFPEAVLQIREALEQEDCDIQRVAKLASLEPVLTSRIMVVANSAFHNPNGIRVADLNAAVMRLGLKEVRNLAITFAVEQIFLAKEQPQIAKPLAILWRRSIALSSVSYVIASQCSNIDPEQAFLCGLLHEVGKLYILIKSVEFPGVTCEIEDGANPGSAWHPQVGRSIVERWGFSEDVCNTLEPVEFLNEVSGAAANIIDVIFAASRICAANETQPVDFDLLSLKKLKIDAGVLEELQPQIAERMESMVQSLK